MGPFIGDVPPSGRLDLQCQSVYRCGCNIGVICIRVAVSALARSAPESPTCTA